MSYSRANPELMSRSGSGSSSEKIEIGDGSGSLKRFTMEPPKDLLPLHKRTKLGYPGLNPQAADQIEDQLTPEKIRQGFFEKFLFKNECQAGFDLMYDLLADRGKLTEMGSLMMSAMRRQRDSGTLRAASVPKIEKISLNEEERDRWLDTITNPERPFCQMPDEFTLGVPHGMRIEQIIKTLAERRCPMSNAIWVIRLVFNSEQQIKKISIPQLTAEWTTQLMRILERGMSDLRSAKGDVEKHVSRWSYFCTLSCQLYYQDLLDQKQFLRWLVDGLSNSSSKGTLLIPIVISLLPEFARSRALCLLLIRGLTPGCEQASATCQPFPAFCRGILEAMLVKLPDTFVGTGPRTSRAMPDWSRLLSGPFKHQEIVYLALGVWPTPESIALAANAVMRRNSRFMACPTQNHPTTISWEAPSSPFPGAITLATDLGEVARGIFAKATSSDWGEVFRVVRRMLQYVAHFGKRDPDIKYLTCGVLRVWAGADCNHQEAIEAALLQFLDEWSGEGREQVMDTLSQLIRQGTFSYMRYLRRAVARGYLNADFTSPRCARRHLEFLNTLPAYAADKDATRQRTATLNIDDHTHAEALIFTLKSHLPALLDPSSRNPAQVAPTADPPNTAPSLTSDFLNQLRTSSRYMRGEVVASLLAGITTYIIKDVQIGEDNWRVISKPGTALISVREFALVAELLEACLEIGALLEISVWVLVNTEERTLLPLLVHIFRRHQSILIACGFVGVVFAALWRKHQEFKTTVNHTDKSATMLLLHLVFNNCPGSTPDIRAELESNLRSLVGRASGGMQDIPEYVAELYDPPSDATALRSRAAGLYVRYRTVPGWWGRLFYNAIQLINHRVAAAEGSKLLQLVRNYSHLFYFLADFSLDTHTVISEWARALLLTSSPPTKWLLVFLALMAARSLCPLPAILSLFLPPQDLPITHDHPLLRGDTLMLLRLLLVGDAALPDGTELCAQDLFALHLTRFTCFASVETLSAPFQLIYQLASLESAYPARDDLRVLRVKLASADWLVHIGRNHSAAIYRRYMLNGSAPLRTAATCTKAIPCLMDSFAMILGEPELAACLNLEPSDFTHPDGHAAFQRNLILTGLHLDKLTCCDPSTCLEEINTYLQIFFCQWVDDPNLPISLLLQAAQAIPAALYPRVLRHARTVLSGTGPCLPDYVDHLTRTLRNAPDSAMRFQLVIQTLLHSGSTLHEWQQAKVSFGDHLFKELKAFGQDGRIQEVMLAANCSYRLASEKSQCELTTNEVSLTIQEQDTENFGFKEMRACIELRFELLAPILPLLVSSASHPKRMEWILTTLEVLTCPILLDPAQNSTFEFALDFFSFLFAEIPKDSKTDTFNHLNTFLLDLPQAVVADPRLARLFQFGTQYAVPEQLFKETDHSKRGRCAYNPWEWDQGFVHDELAAPLSRFAPKHLAKPAFLCLSHAARPPLLECHHLEPTPPKIQSSLPRAASTTISGTRIRFPKTAASPLTSFRGTSPSALHASSPRSSRAPSGLGQHHSYPHPPTSN